MNADELLQTLNLSLRRDSKKYSGCCPVHNGDNIGALNLFYDGYSQPGFWRCYSRGCEKVFQPTIVGFIRGVLSNQQFGWSNKGDQTVSFEDTLQWCLNFLKKNPNEIKVDENQVKKARFISMAQTLHPEQKEIKNKWTKQEFLSRIQPCDYFLKRGFSKEVLGKYDIGLSVSDDRMSLSYNRVLVPVYDDNGQFVVGVQARSLFDRCKKCKCYHHQDDECPFYKGKFAKWINLPDNFEISQHLYNYWFAKKEIKRTGKIIIVEGPPNVWKLEEAGFHNVIAICGSNLSDPQQIILEMSGVSHIYSLLDNDDAGRNCASDIYDKMRRQCKITDIQAPAEFNDVAEMKTPHIQELLGEYIK